VEKYFQEVSLAVEESLKHGAAGRANYLNRLQHIYRDISDASQEGEHPVPAQFGVGRDPDCVAALNLRPVSSEQTKLHRGVAVSTAMPYPEINFLLWRDKEDLCEPNRHR